MITRWFRRWLGLVTVLSTLIVAGCGSERRVDLSSWMVASPNERLDALVANPDSGEQSVVRQSARLWPKGASPAVAIERFLESEVKPDDTELHSSLGHAMGFILVELSEGDRFEGRFQNASEFLANAFVVAKFRVLSKEKQIALAGSDFRDRLLDRSVHVWLSTDDSRLWNLRDAMFPPGSKEKLSLLKSRTLVVLTVNDQSRKES
jgi:hypothetical protein